MKHRYSVTVLVTEKKTVNVFAYNQDEATESGREQAAKYGKNVVHTKVMGCERV